MSKYLNIRTKVDGITFASKREAERYIVLRDKQASGKISSLKLQPKFILQEKFNYNGNIISAITYIADFQYIDSYNITMIEDVKGGNSTQVYNLKKKLLLSIIKDKKILFREIR
jgi:hypothetical protein